MNSNIQQPADSLAIYLFIYCICGSACFIFPRLSLSAALDGALGETLQESVGDWRRCSLESQNFLRLRMLEPFFFLSCMSLSAHLIDADICDQIRSRSDEWRWITDVVDSGGVGFITYFRKLGFLTKYFILFVHHI